MAATSRRHVGRPKLPGSLKLIRLRESVFNLWRARKQAIGFEESTDSEFAEYLLHQRTDADHGSADVNLSLSYEDNRSDTGALPLFSTPIRAHHSSIVDVTSNSTILQSNIVDVMGESRRIQLFSPNNDSFTGNPFSVLESGSDDAFDDSECESLPGENTAVEPSYDFHHFADVEQSVSVILEELNNSDTCTSSDEDSDGSEWSVVEYSNAEDDECVSAGNKEYGSADNFDGTQQFIDESMDISCGDDERTITMVDPCYGDDDASQPGVTEASNASAEGLPQAQDVELQQEEQGEGPSKSAEKNQAEILKKLEDAFNQLTSVDDLETFLALHSRMRVMVSIEKLVELCEDKCVVCSEGLHVKHDVKTIGSRVEITRKCKNGHSQKWVSSEVLGVKNNAKFFLNDSLLAAAIIISGNNYSKFALMCKALGLNTISINTFTRFQKHCAAPVVKEIWNKMNLMIIDILKQYDEVCLCGDGRNDSPGHSARYCVYTLME